MHCRLFIPDFFSAEGAEADRLAAAETLFAKGRRRRLAASSREAWLFERFAVPKQRDWPAAPYTRYSWLTMPLPSKPTVNARYARNGHDMPSFVNGKASWM
jgi:hypothetical protein